MSKVSLMFYKKDCMGCHACEVAWKQEYELGVGSHLVRVIEKSSDFFPVYCHHCAPTPCKEACPVDAISRNDMGLVLIDEELCIGCKACLEACPLGAMQYDDNQETAVNCDLCIDRLKNDQYPACYSVCPARCISWGETKVLSERIVHEALPQKMK